MDIVALSKLLQQHSNIDGDCGTKKSDGSIAENQCQMLTFVVENDHGASSFQITPNVPISSKTTNTANRNGGIWEEEEILNAESVNEDGDKEEPKYEICFKQVVGAEDAFLGMSEKTGSSAECSHVIVKIFLPGCDRDLISLDVTPDQLKLESDKK